MIDFLCRIGRGIVAANDTLERWERERPLAWAMVTIPLLLIAIVIIVHLPLLWPAS